MKGRCCNPKDAKFEHYGGRGIEVCKEWREDIVAFWNDMGAAWFTGATIERNDFNGNYEPGNCCWIPKSQQSRNRRTVITIDTPWGPMIIPEAAKKLGLSNGAFHLRYKHGWRGDKLFSPPQLKGARGAFLLKQQGENNG